MLSQLAQWMLITVVFCLFSATSGAEPLPDVSGSSDAWGVVFAQILLNESDANLTVDGKWGPKTEAAVKSYQEKQGIPVTGTVDALTWQKLFGDERVLYRLDVVVKADTKELYESTFTLTEFTKGAAKEPTEYPGSVMPDNLAASGRLLPGCYPLNLGWHKREGGEPTTEDLKVKTKGNLRPCLVVNRDHDVPVSSNNPQKTTANAIHVHNGFKTERGSEGCLTLHPEKWADFINVFIARFPILQHWGSKDSGYVGSSIGALVVK